MMPGRKAPSPPPKAASDVKEEEMVAADHDEFQQSQEDNSDEDVQTPIHAQPDPESDGSESENEEEVESDTEANPELVASTLQNPSHSKPAAVAAAAVAAAAAASPSKSAGKKVVESKKVAVSKSKKQKKDDGVAEDQIEKKLFKRVFNEADEVVLLERMLEFKKETDRNAMDDLSGYYKFAKDGIHVAVTKEQFERKVKRLKSRYEKNATKGKATFTNGHEQQLYAISFQIWGSEIANGNTEVTVDNGVIRGDRKLKRAKLEQDHSRGSLCMSEMVNKMDEIGAGLSVEYMKRGWELLDDGVKAGFDRNMGDILLEESEIQLKRAELIRKVVKATVHALNASQ